MGFERRPLDWQTVETIKIGSVKVEVNKAIGRSGPVYSARLTRPNRHDRGRDSNYIHAPEDVGDAMEALRRAGEWVERDRNGEE